MKSNTITNFYKFWTAGGNWIVEIPIFQRHYSWKERHIKQMLDDINSINSDGQSNEKYFFGTIFYKKNTDNKGFEILQIIDGQQRLLTSFIMLIVIKNEYPSVYDDFGFTIFNHGNNSNRIRFKTEIGDDQKNIDRLSNGNVKNIKKEKSKILKCYSIIKDFFNDEVVARKSPKEEIIEKFKLFFTKLENCEIAINEIDDNNNMYQIFHSINAKVEHLSILNILNNYILQYGERNQQIKILWQNIRSIFEDKLKEFVKFEYLIRYLFWYIKKRDVRINNLINTFCHDYDIDTKIFDAIKLIDDFLNFIIERVQSKKCKYSILLNDKTILFGQLFYCHKEYPEMYDKFEEIMISYLIRRNICGLDSKGITSLFPTLIPTILSNNNNQFTLDGIKRFFKDLNGKNGYFPNNEELKENLINKNFYSKKNICKKILLLVEKFGYHRLYFDINDLNDTTIEHINSQEKWSYLDDNINDCDKYNLNNSIGNLTLLPKSTNSSFKNANWIYKKQYLSKNGTYAMNTLYGFDKYNSWGINEIKKRSESLFEIIKQLFPSIF